MSLALISSSCSLFSCCHTLSLLFLVYLTLHRIQFMGLFWPLRLLKSWNALRVSPAVTRLTVYRRPQVRLRRGQWEFWRYITIVFLVMLNLLFNSMQHAVFFQCIVMFLSLTHFGPGTLFVVLESDGLICSHWWTGAPQSIALVAIWIWLVGLNCVSRGVFSFVPAGWRVSSLVAFITFCFSREWICKSSVNFPRR